MARSHPFRHRGCHAQHIAICRESTEEGETSFDCLSSYVHIPYSVDMVGGSEMLIMESGWCEHIYVRLISWIRGLAFGASDPFALLGGPDTLRLE